MTFTSCCCRLISDRVREPPDDEVFVGDYVVSGVAVVSVVN